MREIHQTWVGVVWFIEGDIAQCFTSLSYSILLETLSEHIHDGRFLRLISNLLKAGYLEDWKFHQTYSGTPQGSICSPILTNIYLHRLDTYIMETLIPVYTKGQRRKKNHAYFSQSKWVVDVTRFKMQEGTLFLAGVLDIFSRSLVGWALGSLQDALLVENARPLALLRRHPLHGLLHHSDRGSGYTSLNYRDVLQRAGMVVSMSRTGNCYDNAVLESFWSTLK